MTPMTDYGLPDRRWKVVELASSKWAIVSAPTRFHARIKGKMLFRGSVSVEPFEAKGDVLPSVRRE